MLDFKPLEEANLDPESQELVKAQKEAADDLLKIAELMRQPNAEQLKAMIKKDLDYFIRKMVVDDDPSQIPHIAAYLRLIDKLSTGEQLDAIGMWVEEKVNSIK